MTFFLFVSVLIASRKIAAKRPLRNMLSAATKRRTGGIVQNSPAIAHEDPGEGAVRSGEGVYIGLGGDCARRRSWWAGSS
jgi:hypothetical protein